jgi:hypothetical protein
MNIHKAASQRLIPTGERSVLQTRIATTEGVSVRADEKLTAFLELGSTTLSPSGAHSSLALLQSVNHAVVLRWRPARK